MKILNTKLNSYFFISFYKTQREMKTKPIIPILLLLSSCNSTLKLNKVSMREYFSHIHKSGSYEVGQVIGNKAVLKLFKDTIYIGNVGEVKKGDFINVIVLK